ncbi:hypothetical protein M8C17_00925 [Micromonospora sp. RHAY321]|uniref:hypothetical protein n=1 Tax=Micromonospora sp. RHAY321 TaxID=2944807 RepID=UPI00207C7240|nr:hypothetical protein [Micromonospora sp. RHAY321]MCO1593727.1 hypothetical protein [Micromonospora sp. RHAY321]
MQRATALTVHTTGALIVGYLVALAWWGIRLTAHTLRLAFPQPGLALRRLTDRHSNEKTEEAVSGRSRNHALSAAV